MNWDYMLDPPEYDDELEVEYDADYDPYDELEPGDWGSDERERMMDQNY